MKIVLFLLALSSLCHAGDDWPSRIAKVTVELGKEASLMMCDASPTKFDALGDQMPAALNALQKGCSHFIDAAAKSGNPMIIGAGAVVVAIPTLGICAYHAGKALGVFPIRWNARNYLAYENNIQEVSVQELEQDFIMLQRNELPAQVRRTPTGRLYVLAQSEEASVGDKCTFWREKYAERLKEEADADRQAAISQGTLDEDN